MIIIVIAVLDIMIVMIIIIIGSSLEFEGRACVLGFKKKRGVEGGAVPSAGRVGGGSPICKW